jgi:hypothetical protein
MKMNKTVLLITRTAILLALTVLFQSLRVIFPIPANISQFLIGSLVNLTLIVSAVMVGLKGGLAVAVVAPIIAFMQGFTPFPVLVPFIAAGNLVLVVAVALMYEKRSVLSIALGAVIKFVVLYLGIVQIALPFLIPNIKPPQVAALSAAFSWPQLVTAAIGGAVALAVLPLLKRAIKF